MELLQLRYFQTVARLESITKAANYHQIPQPAMSQTIARLEKELGNIRLFDRRSNHIILNGNGRQFLQFVNQALTSLDDGIKAVTSQKNDISGSINLLVMENRRFVLACASTFAQNHPNVNFSISHEYSPDSLQAYDLCVCSAPVFMKMTNGLPLIREKIIVNLNNDHPLAGRKELMLSELKNEKFITMTSHSNLYRLTISSCRAAGFEPKTPFICDDPYFVRKYVAENMGIALAPSISWAGRFRSNTSLIPLVNPSLESTSYLLWDSSRYLTPAMDAFRDYMLQQAGEIEDNLLNTEKTAPKAE